MQVHKFVKISGRPDLIALKLKSALDAARRWKQNGVKIMSCRLANKLCHTATTRGTRLTGNSPSVTWRDNEKLSVTTAKMAEDVVVFHRNDLPTQAFPVMEEIRRRGKLCDVTLKVMQPLIVNKMKTPGHGVLLCYFVAIVRVCLSRG